MGLCSPASLVLCEVDRPTLSGQVRMWASTGRRNRLQRDLHVRSSLSGLQTCYLAFFRQPLKLPRAAPVPTSASLPPHHLSCVHASPHHFQPLAQLTVLARQPTSCPSSPGMEARSHTHPGLGQEGGLAPQVGGWR